MKSTPLRRPGVAVDLSDSGHDLGGVASSSALSPLDPVHASEMRRPATRRKRTGVLRDPCPGCSERALISVLILLLVVLFVIVMGLLVHGGYLSRMWTHVSAVVAGATTDLTAAEKRSAAQSRPALRSQEKAKADAQLSELLRNMGDSLDHMTRGNFSLATCLRSHIGLHVYTLPLPPALNRELLPPPKDKQTKRGVGEAAALDCRLMDSRTESTLWRLFLESSVRCDSPLEANFVYVPVMCACAGARGGPRAAAALLEEAVTYTRDHLGDVYASRLLWPFTARGGYAELVPLLRAETRHFVEKGVHLTHRALRPAAASGSVPWPDPSPDPSQPSQPSVISIPPDLYGGLLQWQALPAMLRLLDGGGARSTRTMRQRRVIDLTQQDQSDWMSTVLSLAADDLLRAQLVERICGLPTEQHGLLSCGEVADRLLDHRLLAESLADQHLDPQLHRGAPQQLDDLTQAIAQHALYSQRQHHRSFEARASTGTSPADPRSYGNGQEAYSAVGPRFHAGDVTEGESAVELRRRDNPEEAASAVELRRRDNPEEAASAADRSSYDDEQAELELQAGSLPAADTTALQDHRKLLPLADEEASAADPSVFRFGGWTFDAEFMRELGNYWREHGNSTSAAIRSLLGGEEKLKEVRELAIRFMDEVVHKHRTSVSSQTSGGIAFVSPLEKDIVLKKDDPDALSAYLRSYALLSMFSHGRQFELAESGVRCVESHGPFHRQMPLSARELIRVCEVDPTSAAAAAAAMQSLFVLIPCDHPQNDLLYRVLGNNMIPLFVCDYWELPFESLLDYGLFSGGVRTDYQASSVDDWALNTDDHQLPQDAAEYETWQWYGAHTYCDLAMHHGFDTLAARNHRVRARVTHTQAICPIYQRELSRYTSVTPSSERGFYPAVSRVALLPALIGLIPDGELKRARRGGYPLRASQLLSYPQRPHVAECDAFQLLLEELQQRKHPPLPARILLTSDCIDGVGCGLPVLLDVLSDLDFDLPRNKLGADGAAGWHWLRDESSSRPPAARWSQRPPLALFTSRVHLIHHPARAIPSLTETLAKNPTWRVFVNDFSSCSTMTGTSLSVCLWIEWNRMAMNISNVKVVRIEELETVEGLTQFLSELWSGANGITLDRITATQPKLLRFLHSLPGELSVPSAAQEQSSVSPFTGLNPELNQQLLSLMSDLGYM